MLLGLEGHDFVQLWGTSMCCLTHPHLRNPMYLFADVGLDFGWIRFGQRATGRAHAKTPSPKNLSPKP